MKKPSFFSVLLWDFFSVLNVDKYHKALGNSAPNQIVTTPLSIMDFFVWSRNFQGLDPGFHAFGLQMGFIKNGIDLMSRRQVFCDLARKLQQGGILEYQGGKFLAPYYRAAARELTRQDKKGVLWIGEALGIGFIAQEMSKTIAWISGVEKGDPAVGTGTLVAPGIILTCAHVLTDMDVKDVVVNGQSVKFEGAFSHPKIDVGIIRVSTSAIPVIPDIALRDDRLMEEVAVVGYQKIPSETNGALVYARGEICGHAQETTFGHPLVLFSAINRPGNSGAPIFGRDGKILGIVSRNLNKQREATDHVEPLSFLRVSQRQWF